MEGRLQAYLLDELIESSTEGLADEQVCLSLIIIGHRGLAAVRAACEPASLCQCFWGRLPGGVCRHKVGSAEHFLLQAAGSLLACLGLQGACFIGSVQAGLSRPHALMLVS